MSRRLSLDTAMRFLLASTLTLASPGLFATQDSSDLARSVFKDSLAAQSSSAASGAGSGVGFGGTYVAPPPPAVAPPTTPQAGAGTNNAGTNSGTSSGTGSGSGAALHDGSGVQAPTAPTGNSINPSAKQGQGSQIAGAAINMAAGAAFIYMCLSPKPPQYPLCVMGALAIAQGALTGAAAGDSGNTAKASDGSGLYTGGGGNGTNPTPTTPEVPGGGGGGPPGTTPPPPGTNPTAPLGKVGYNDPKVKAGLDALKNAGYTVTPQGVTSPDGKFTPASAYNSAAGMASAGMSAGAIKEALKISAALNDEISKLNAGKVSEVGVADGAGGGGGTSGGGGSESSSLAGTKGHPFALNEGSRQQIVAGKTVMFGGEPIGVRGQDIFEMVHTAYEKKRQRANFIESESGGVQPRAPASVPPKKK